MEQVQLPNVSKTLRSDINTLTCSDLNSFITCIIYFSLLFGLIVT